MERRNSYWWSLDSKFIAFTQVNSSNIPLFRIMHQGKSNVGAGAHEDHAYPFAGASNVKVHLGVVYSSGGLVTWMDLLPGEKDQTNSDEENLAQSTRCMEIFSLLNAEICQYLRFLGFAPKVSLFSLHDGSMIMHLYEQSFTAPRFKKLQRDPPELVQMKAKDGTILYGSLYKPNLARFGSPPYKTMVSM
ncbi:hypothetical protein LguiA_024183 [Lonicera macranthoides]